MLLVFSPSCLPITLLIGGGGLYYKSFYFVLLFFCLFVCLFVCFYNSTVKVSGPHQIVLTSAFSELTFKCWRFFPIKLSNLCLSLFGFLRWKDSEFSYFKSKLSFIQGHKLNISLVFWGFKFVCLFFFFWLSWVLNFSDLKLLSSQVCWFPTAWSYLLDIWSPNFRVLKFFR